MGVHLLCGSGRVGGGESGVGNVGVGQDYIYLLWVVYALLLGLALRFEMTRYV